jgi:hypothetical protein
MFLTMFDKKFSHEKMSEMVMRNQQYLHPGKNKKHLYIRYDLNRCFLDITNAFLSIKKDSECKFNPIIGSIPGSDASSKELVKKLIEGAVCRLGLAGGLDMSVDYRECGNCLALVGTRQWSAGEGAA